VVDLGLAEDPVTVDEMAGLLVIRGMQVYQHKQNTVEGIINHRALSHSYINTHSCPAHSYPMFLRHSRTLLCRSHSFNE
jgi:hypothetical protein